MNSGTNSGDLAERVNSGTNPGDLAERVNSSTSLGDLAENMNSGTNLVDLAERVGITSSDSSSSVRIISSPGSGGASQGDPEASSSGVSSGPPSPVDVRFLSDLEVMKVDHDLDTAVTEGSLAVIRGRYSIPTEYGLHVPWPGQRPYSSDVPDMSVVRPLIPPCLCQTDFPVSKRPRWRASCPRAREHLSSDAAPTLEYQGSVWMLKEQGLTARGRTNMGSASSQTVDNESLFKA
ncbi:hypothetical protein BHM03_00008067 [Ensete ventricosum]|nr:hypothetical protein BHM03_00008067 [Ensete ventricosum]